MLPLARLSQPVLLPKEASPYLSLSPLQVPDASDSKIGPSGPALFHFGSARFQQLQRTYRITYYASF